MKICKKSCSVVLVIVVLMSLALTGCGDVEIREVISMIRELGEALEDMAEERETGPAEIAEEQEPGGEQIAAGVQGDPSAFQPTGDRWIDNFQDFFRLVRSGRWNRVSPACGPGTSVYSYNYEGPEMPAGAGAEKISGQVSNEYSGTLHWEAWVGDDGRILKVISEGEEVEEMFREFVVLAFIPPIQHFLLPDPAFNQDFKQALGGEQVPGWDILDYDEDTAQVANLPATVCTVSLIHSSFNNELARFKYGDFGSFILMLDSYLAYGQSSTMTTELIEFR